MAERLGQDELSSFFQNKTFCDSMIFNTSTLRAALEKTDRQEGNVGVERGEEMTDKYRQMTNKFPSMQQDNPFFLQVTLCATAFSTKFQTLVLQRKERFIPGSAF